MKTDKYNNYLVEAENFAGDIPFYDSKYKTCPSITPFYDGENCIECPPELLCNGGDNVLPK